MYIHLRDSNLFNPSEVLNFHDKRKIIRRIKKHLALNYLDMKLN